MHSANHANSGSWLSEETIEVSDAGGTDDWSIRFTGTEEHTPALCRLVNELQDEMERAGHRRGRFKFVAAYRKAAALQSLNKRKSKAFGKNMQVHGACAYTPIPSHQIFMVYVRLLRWIDNVALRR